MPTVEHDIMTIEEVANYLRVSERTVYDWAKRGEIPSGKLGTGWRFKRSAVEAWADRRLMTGGGLGDSTEIPRAEIESVLSPERVLLLGTQSKETAFLELIDCLSKGPGAGDRDLLTAEIFRREGLVSTAIGLGLGVPHVRLRSCSSVIVAVGVARDEITDYVSLDGVAVRIICMIIAGVDHHVRYLGVLAALIERLRSDRVREAMLRADDALGAYGALVAGEPSRASTEQLP